FFTRSRPPLYLHSFPTRRSSDLVWDEFVQNRVEAGYDPEAATAAARRGDRLSAQATKSGTRGLRGAVGTPDQVRDYLRRYEAFEDRKSTRLNSSHLVISYAVFCL